MRRSAALAAIVLSLPAAVEAAPRWTFCVAASQDGADVWISEVFPAEGSRERLEDAFKSAVAQLGAASAFPAGRQVALPERSSRTKRATARRPDDQPIGSNAKRRRAGQ